MRIPRDALTLLALLAVSLPSAAQEPKRPAGDGEALKGIWAAESVVLEGRKLPDDPTRGPLMLAFDGASYVQRQGESITEEGSYELGVSKDPNAIDLVITRGDNGGERQLGIYRVAGDTLTLCVSRPGAKTRPKDFGGKSGVVVLMRRYRR